MFCIRRRTPFSARKGMALCSFDFYQKSKLLYWLIKRFNPSYRRVYFLGDNAGEFWEFFEKWIILLKIDKNCFLEKCVLELCRTATIQPRQIERSGFLLLDHNGQTWIYRLVWGPMEVWLRRNWDFPTKEDDYATLLPRIIRVEYVGISIGCRL